MNIDTPKILIIILIISLLLTPIAIYTTGPLRIILGLPFILFFPGYTLSLFLFPRQNEPDNIMRVALSFGLSIAVVTIIGLALNYTPWGIRLYPILITLTLFILVASIIAWFRQRRLDLAQRFSIQVNIKWPGLTSMRYLNTVLFISLAIAIMIAIGCLAFVIAAPKEGEKFTEYYVLNAEGKAENYPQQVASGENIEMIVGVVNHEYAPLSYRVEIKIDDARLEEIRIATLAQEEKWEETVSFTMQTPGKKKKVEFWLYKGSDVEPYFKEPLHFYIDVKN
jgi:uncharacterized membrane protein